MPRGGDVTGAIRQARLSLRPIILIKAQIEDFGHR